MCQFAHSTWQKIGWLLSSLTAALALRRCLQQIAALPTFTQSLQHNAQCLKIPRRSHLNFQFWHFPPIFVLFKGTFLVILFDHKLQFFKTRQIEHFWHF